MFVDRLVNSPPGGLTVPPCPLTPDVGQASQPVAMTHCRYHPTDERPARTCASRKTLARLRLRRTAACAAVYNSLYKT